MKNITIDAVEMQRTIREKLSKEYKKNPSLRKKRLAAIRKKYGLVETTKRFNRA